MMKVHELIAALQQLDADAEVVVCDDEGYYVPADLLKPMSGGLVVEPLIYQRQGEQRSIFNGRSVPRAVIIMNSLPLPSGNWS